MVRLLAKEESLRKRRLKEWPAVLLCHSPWRGVPTRWPRLGRGVMKSGKEKLWKTQASWRSRAIDKHKQGLVLSQALLRKTLPLKDKHVWLNKKACWFCEGRQSKERICLSK